MRVRCQLCSQVYGRGDRHECKAPSEAQTWVPVKNAVKNAVKNGVKNGVKNASHVKNAPAARSTSTARSR
jgi:hypothetical protein